MKRLMSKLNKKLKTVLSLVLVAALVVGVINIGPTNARADEGTPNTSEFVGYAVLNNDGTIKTQKGKDASVAEVVEDGITLSKTIEKSKDNDPFGYDITLSVSTSKTVTSEDVAIILLMDVSASMLYKINDVKRLTYTQNAAKNFIDSISNQIDGNIYVSLVQFGTDAEKVSDWFNIKNANEKAAVKEKVDSLKAESGVGTNVEAGFKLSINRLNMEAVNGCSKYCVFLSDGAPGDYCTDSSRKSNSTEKIAGNDFYSNQTREATLKAVAMAQTLRADTTLLSVYIGSLKEALYSRGMCSSEETVDDFLKEISSYTKDKNGNTTSTKAVYSATDENGFTSAFASVAETIVNGSDGKGWKVIDPIPEYIICEDAVDGQIEWHLSDTEPETTPKSNTTTYTYTKTYHVVLDASMEGFENGKSYPTNGRTYLNYDGENKAIDFLVPVVKGYAPVYDYKINYYYEDANGSTTVDGKKYALDASKQGTGSAKVNTVVELSGISGYDQKWTKADGYVYSKADKESMKIAAGDNVINVYYDKAAFDYTVKYYVDNASDPVATWTSSSGNGTSIVWGKTASFGINWNDVFEADKFSKNITVADVTPNINAASAVTITKDPNENKWSFTMPKRDVEIRVDLTTNTYEVVYRDGNTTVKKYPSVAWGTKIDEIPEAIVHPGYVSASWSEDLAGKVIKENHTVELIQGDLINYDVIFEVYVGGELKIVEGVTNTQANWGGIVALPTVTAEAAGAVDSNAYAYNDEGWKIVSGTAELSDGNVTDIQSTVTVRRTFSATPKSPYVFQVVNTGDGITGTTSANHIETQYLVNRDDITYPTLAGYTETGDDNNTFSYAFEMDGENIKWVETTEGGVTCFTATRVRTYKKYAVTFTFTCDYDSEKSKSTTVDYHYGDIPVLPDGYPTAQTENDAQYTYTFTPWQTLEQVTKATEYTASESRTVNKYSYSFTLIDSKNENQLIASGTAEYGSIIDVPTYVVPELTGYAVTPVLSENWPDGTSFELTGDLAATVTMCYTADSCVVTFKFVAIDEYNVSRETLIATVPVSYDAIVAFPAIPEGLVKTTDAEFTYSGLAITGRPDELADQSDFTCKGNTTVTVTQTQTRNNYTVNFVIFDVDNGTVSASASAAYGSKATVPATISIPTVEGCKDRLDADQVKMGLKYDYTVTGWCTDEACTIPADLKVTGDTTVYAKVTKADHLYTVNFLFNAYDTATKTMEGSGTQYKYGDKITAPICVGHSDGADYTYTITYSREGWKSVEGIENGFTVTDITAGDYVATETRTLNNYSVSFVVRYSGDDSVASEKTVSVVTAPYGASVKAPTVDRSTDSEFFKEDTEKWDYPESITFNGVNEVTGPHIEYFDYIPTLKTYDAIFYDESGNVIISQSAIGYGQRVTATPGNQTKDNDEHYHYDFLGWAAKGDETKKLVDFVNEEINMTDEGLEFVAVFEAIEWQYRVYFYDYNGTNIDGNFAPQAVWNTTNGGFYLTEEALLEAADLGKAGAAKRSNSVDTYTFTGWKFKNSDDADAEYVDASGMISGKINTTFIVYASYTSAKNTYTIRYHFEDRIEAPYFAEDVVTAGGIITVRAEGPSKDSNETQNFFFAGWVIGPAPEKENADIPSDEPATEPAVEPADDSAAAAVPETPVAPVSGEGGVVIGPSVPGGPIRVLSTEAPSADLPSVDASAVTPLYVTVLDMTNVACNFDLYPVYTDGVRYYTVKFLVDGNVVKVIDNIEYNGTATAPVVNVPATEDTATYTKTYAFSGWDKAFDVITSDLIVNGHITSNTVSKINYPAIDNTTKPTLTPEPTATPTPMPEIDVEQTETPEGAPEPTATPVPEDVDLEVGETPEGTPDEDIDVDLDLTPQGLPKTGVVAAGVLYGIGSACIVLGSYMTRRFRRKEDEE